MARQCLQREPGYADCRVIAALSCVALGRAEDARREAAELLRQDPTWKLAALEGRLSIERDRELVARVLAGCRDLGLQ